MIGSVGFVSIDWTNDTGEIGYWVAPWGRGRTRPAGRRGCWPLGRARAGADPRRAEISTHNQTSQRSAEQAGFKWEGVLRSALAHRDERHDLAVFSLLAGEI